MPAKFTVQITPSFRLWMRLLPDTASRDVDQMVACAISESVE